MAIIIWQVRHNRRVTNNSSHSDWSYSRVSSSSVFYYDGFV